MTNRGRDDSTRERLLNVAGETFAEKGFRATTVREVCERARANVAAVSYHFGGKNELYEQVLGSLFTYTMGKYPPDLGQDKARTPGERLFAFIHSFLLRMLDPDKPVWHRKLIAHEMADPSQAMRHTVGKGIRKGRRLLQQILTEALGPNAGEECVDRCIASVVGQCLFYHRGDIAPNPAGQRIEPTPDGVDKLARHITEFSLGGIKRRRRK